MLLDYGVTNDGGKGMKRAKEGKHGNGEWFGDVADLCYFAFCFIVLGDANMSILEVTECWYHV